MADISPCNAASYDVIVVGGGTAGCVMATRLSEIPSLKILLLEGGGNHNDDSRVKIPALFPQAINDPNLDWNYQTTSQKELNGKTICQARGKGLDMGNPGWDWNLMHSYLRKFQTFHMPGEAVQKALRLEYIDKSAQGRDGPIQASYQHEPSVLDKAWIDTFNNMGCSMKNDSMPGSSLGGYQITSSIQPKTRERSHAGNAYLDQARARPNLEIVSNVLVDRIIFTTNSPLRACGIVFSRNNHTYSVKTDRKVILCGGVFGSSSLLERSGVGRSDVLQSLGVPVLVENENVGENLQDHLMIAVSFEFKEGIEAIDNFRDPSYVQSAMAQYQESRTGPLAGAFVNFAYMPLIDAEKQEQRSKLQELIEMHRRNEMATSAVPVNRASQEFSCRVLLDPGEASANVCMGTSQIHMEHNTMAKIFELTDTGNHISIYTALAHPMSRGSVHITSTSSSVAPRIDPRYFSHPLDLKVMVEHVHELFPRIVSTSPLAHLSKLEGRRIPHYADFSDPRVTENIIRERCTSNLHPCGTCAMLPRAQGGVVDSRLSCYGVKGLRIVDASIMPIIPRGNIMSSVYALAEKGADLVKEDLAATS